MKFSGSIKDDFIPSRHGFSSYRFKNEKYSSPAPQISV
jgi:hypothetical protein